ncbi:hypothetical protein EDB80DRAFT_427077 [Ilyonectria destructans]|nr:hypothetical protein EDB80DRAFT_427077 [Ilyonectria destructans]
MELSWQQGLGASWRGRPARVCSLPGSPLEEGIAKGVPGRSRMPRCLSRPVEACRTCSEPAYIGDPCGHPRYSHAWLAHSQRTFVVQLASSTPRPVLGNPCKSAVMGSLSQDGHRDASKHTNSSWAGTRRPQGDPTGGPPTCRFLIPRPVVCQKSRTRRCSASCLASIRSEADGRRDARLAPPASTLFGPSSVSRFYLYQLARGRTAPSHWRRPLVPPIPGHSRSDMLDHKLNSQLYRATWPCPPCRGVIRRFAQR